MNRAEDADRRMGKWMIVGAWIVALAMLTWFFHAYLERQNHPNRQPLTMTDAQGAPTVVLQRNRAGHYLANGRINGHSVVFLLDTGATHVAVPARLARRIGLKGRHKSLSHTANGTITTWSTRLDTVSLGGILLTDIRASILPNMPADEVLLGMAFLKHLELIQRGDTLTLRQVKD